jgi:Mg-chelatase subunit ChlD
MRLIPLLTIAALAALVVLTLPNLTPTTDAAPSARNAAAKPKPAPTIDLVFALDTTGSMSDEIALVRRLVWDLANGLITGSPRPSIRLGLVRFRDTSDTYVVKVTPLTFDLDAVHKELMQTRASGGGDTPEHVNLGLHKALDQKWRAGATRLVFLIGDAKPKRYGDYFHDREARRARKLGVRVHTLGCSGLSAGGIAVFKAIARLSGGAYADLPRTSARRGSTSDRRLRDLILRGAGLAAYASKAPPPPPVAARPRPTPRPAAAVRAPAASDPRDRGYAPTPDRVWRSRVE